ncbi:NAD(P)-dependent oxidoreductase [Vagococcus xieshaowenii]|uniref:NAD(P)-dependent oxidoreductase n=1 Tax=Vagococcus xieshaowenii TaxID=2562451 RepID=A0AAJ5JQJ1_9ENTE|nr:NAD(P)H-binding protein [Vagococcus xieshaowenii]QCA29613.1 NAD(P)-dependent oxidoreductase [Vagococcus xieshaowenii]TFZ41032.1 NAD(P)-dependent oxidoreductase [Vagococcus xieshaowenii]
MKIGIIAANGKVGQLITEEAVNKGYEVTAIVRNDNKTTAPRSLQKDLFDLTRDDISSFDVIIDAAGFWQPEDLIKHQTSIAHLTDILKGTPTRLIIVGGAGSLYMDATHTIQLKDTPDFPEAYKPLAESMAKGLDLLRERHDSHWVYVSPAADFIADGEKTGQYAFTGEEFTVNKHGKSYLSYADYATALVELLEDTSINQQRVAIYTK